MRHFTRALPLLLLLFTTLSLASEARAEHIVITSGSASHGNPVLFVFPGYGFGITGDGLTAGGSGEKLGGAFPLSCYQCAAGQTLRTGANITQFTTGYPGTATYNGVSYTNVWFQGSRLTFVIEPVVIPFDAPEMFDLVSPFTFDGVLTGSVFPYTSPIFSMTLSGQGIATLTMIRRSFPDGFVYTLYRTTYTFQPAAAVPEPATLLLLGTGLTGVAERMRRRRKASRRGASAGAA